jgi:PBSX family phage terminase large subunit
VTFTQRVLATGRYKVEFFGGSKLEPAQFRYANGSRIVVGGLDKPTKIMSSEYDLAYINEGTEASEEDYESVSSRLRYGVMPYQQLITDCNPDAPTHWLNQRANAGKTKRILTRHEDNPVLFDPSTREWTRRGAEYIARLDRLTGVRFKRLRLGLWVAAEGQVYEGFDPAMHVIDFADLVRWGWAAS